MSAAALSAAPAAGRLERAGARAAPAPPSVVTFVITGRGWGHGVGLAQYGALGFAKHGATYDAILAHFYPGTRLAPAPVSRVRVLLAEKRKTVKISSEAGFRVRGGGGVERALPAGEVTVAPREAQVIVSAGEKKIGLTSPVSFLRGTAPLSLDGRSYRGALELALTGKRLNVIDVVGIDQYLYGVVTNEMPHDWPSEALKAQAVAARSYALANRFTGSFDLYADVRSQVYGGIESETPEGRAAVDATARRVLFHNSQIANTFFFSSSGGRTADVTEVWGTKPVPYLVSVEDPYDTLSPYHRWGPVTIAGGRAGKALRVAGLQDLVVATGPSGRARAVTATGVLGRTEIGGSAFRRALELRSTWIKIGLLALDRPDNAVYGTPVRLTGRVRALKATLEQRVPGSTWGGAVPIAATADGSFAAAPKPSQTTEFRLRSGTAVGQAVRLVVVPVVRAAVAPDGAGVTGVVRPVFEGGLVELQLARSEAWRAVATAPIAADGRFAVQATLPAGSYRVRYAPGHGFGAGVSAVLHLDG